LPRNFIEVLGPNHFKATVLYLPLRGGPPTEDGLSWVGTSMPKMDQNWCHGHHGNIW
jgi:hypothetical protein